MCPIQAFLPVSDPVILDHRPGGAGTLGAGALPASRAVVASGPLPDAVRVVLGQGIFVEKAGLPSPILNQMKRLAAFQNPEFYKRQAMRLHTGVTPRVTACAEEEAHHVHLSRGLLDDLRDLLAAHGIAIELQDERVMGDVLPVRFAGELRAEQAAAVDSVLQHDVGLLVAPPGTGKTVMAAALVAARGRTASILVHTRALLSQWVDHLATFLGVDRDEVGVIGGGMKRPNGRLDLAMVQSLVDREGVDDRVAGYGHVVLDEAHHVSAVSFDRVLREVKACFVLGLTATPYRRGGHHPIPHMQCGPVRASPRGEGAGADVPWRLIRRDTGVTLPHLPGDAPITHVHAALAAHDDRTSMIVADIEAAARDGRTPIALTERVSHLQEIAERLRASGIGVVTLRGGMGRKEKAAADRAPSAPGGERPQVLVRRSRGSSPVSR